MLRGLAKPDGERLVWDIVSDGPTLTVNGSICRSSAKPKGKPSMSEAGSAAEPVERDLALGAVLQFQAGRHAVDGEGGQAVARQIGASGIGEPDLGVAAPCGAARAGYAPSSAPRSRRRRTG